MRALLILTLAAGTLSAVEPGFVSLFNGKDLTGWTLVNKKGGGYIVKDGVIACEDKGGGNLLTEQEFSDFILKLEFKLPPGGNNGIGLRAPLAGDIAYSGIEIQVLDQDHEKYKGWLQDWQRTGSLYNVFPAAPGNALKPVGEWNEYEITVKGTKFQVVLNGTKILDADTSTVTDPEIIKKHPGIRRTSGRVGFLGHNDPVEFRNIRIKTL
jgi:hypothetical protein